MKRATAFILFVLVFAVTGAEAKAPVAFTPSALEAAQTSGEPVIVHVTAPWCSTCAAQIPIVLSLLQEPKYKDLVVLNLDFDHNKAQLRMLGVQAQSTFVAFKGTHEVARSTGDTDKTSIEQLFDKTE